MSILITVPAADFSAIGNPKVNKLLYGFPADNLEALHFFESGTVGEPYVGPSADQSGKGNTAPLIPGSSAFKTAGGVATSLERTTRTAGFGIFSPVPLTDRFTVFGVSRNLLAPDAAIVGNFLVPWSASGDWNTPAQPLMTNTNRASVNGADGLLHINQQNNGTGSTAAEIAALSFRATPNNSQAWGGGQVRPGVVQSGTPKDSFIAWALSFDRAAGYTFRALGQGGTITDPEHAALWIDYQKSVGARHVFGAVGYTSQTIVGEMAMAGIYKNVSKTAGEMDALIAVLKSRMALRGITAL
ncbi:hypothetical protein [Sphingomonas sp. 3-13AW]|uniref:hypothetical protein n=1 Tax=Sphingomonas sp. 3-13AW TaxID=3050450 RepID=UPI003BB792BD